LEKGNALRISINFRKALPLHFGESWGEVFNYRWFYPNPSRKQ